MDHLADLTYESSPDEHLYTNGVQPYYPAPQILIGLPTRYIKRGKQAPMKSLPDPDNRAQRAVARERYGHALTERLFMSIQDGIHFKRWNKAFLRPGPERSGTWLYGAHSLAWGVFETRSSLSDAPNVLSLYASEDYWHGKVSALRRYTLRLDGFISASANLEGGNILTKPFAKADPLPAETVNAARLSHGL